MKLKFILLMTVLFSNLGHAQEDEALIEKKSNFQITDDYRSGSSLIFNCRIGYYTCVDIDSYNLCRKKRDEEISKKSPEYSCAPLKTFKTKVECGKKNYEVVESLAKKRFCYPK